MTSVRHGLLMGAAFAFTVALADVAWAGAPQANVWSIESGKIDPKGYFGATVANGMIGILSAPAPFKTQHTLIAGTFELTKPTEVSDNILRTFDVLHLAVSIDGERIDSLDEVRNFHQQLKMRHAAFTTSFDYQDKAQVVYTMRALRQLPHVALMEVTVVAKRPITLEPASTLDAPPSLTDRQLYDIAIHAPTAPHGAVSMLGATAKGPSGRTLVAAAQAFILNESSKTAPVVARQADRLTFTKQLDTGATYRFALVASTVTSTQSTDALNAARRSMFYAALQGANRLIEQHERAWAQLWQSDIVIEGDPAVQREVRSMLYHLYSFGRAGTSLSIPPMGLSSDDYYGHIFWDAEMWMLPALLALQPDMAKAMLDYRYERLPAAQQNAANYGFRGAMFPWQSASSGEEDTPIGASNAGLLEQHITADVGIAAWNYYRVTQDRDWLRKKGYALIKETADFWTSRVERNGPGRYDISNVVAADEYAENVDNNAFTNAAARENLAAATAAAKVLGLHPDPDWQHVRENIPILRFPNGVTREHATYDGKAIKQADVNLLAYPLQVIVDPAAIRRDLQYYEARIDHAEGPAMTKSIFAILYAHLGEPDKAYAMFKRGYVPNQLPPFGVISENARYPHPYFVTGAGGLLQTLLYGFGGLKITDEGLVQQHSKLPAVWKSLTLIGVGPEKRTYVMK